MKNYGKLLVILTTMLLVITASLGSVVADSNDSNSSNDSKGKVYIHTYGHGSTFKSAEWDSPNGIKFRDKAWLLAFVASYEIKFINDDLKVVGTASGKMTSGSADRSVDIPMGATMMQVSASSSGGGGSYYFVVPAEDAAMAFDGTTGTRNFHLKTKSGYDSGYKNIPLDANLLIILLSPFWDPEAFPM
ncbi:hypothetical protein MARBORIA2_11620 [Methanobrevibacter arboriphilus]|uniref:hypothetical protein n=1 Tax=Methanobrevibacter arboriphilus TaxID=39441 RepID=UPI0022EE2EB9|nr:hypothetical protein [Methanobrevibacter arboriphilus]GLI12072.1 hypothetical protein MARBORIA2_11620 [Methanobrevibacter arboriphilus]